MLVLRIVTFVIAVLLDPAAASQADTSHCSQISELPAAHARWAAARKSRVDPAQNDKNCRAYGTHFYEAVTARQAVSLCRSGADYGQEIASLDFEIDAFNNLIATQCGS
jgi:hypothetical protein